MQLPQIAVPEYNITLPLSKKEIRYRCFLAKEEKILLMAVENFNEKEDSNSLIDATIQIAQNCIVTKDVDVKTLPTVDIEWLFLNIRKKSIGETIDIMIQHNKNGCDAKNKVNINLNNTVFINDEKHSKKIEITPTSGVIMKYPSLNNAVKLNSSNKTEFFFNNIIENIDQIYDGEDFASKEDFDSKELLSWLEKLPTEIVHKFYSFFDTIPHLKTEIKYKCNKCGEEETMEVKGVSDFFT